MNITCDKIQLVINIEHDKDDEPQFVTAGRF